jgi:hypothetical protein
LTTDFADYADREKAIRQVHGHIFAGYRPEMNIREIRAIRGQTAVMKHDKEEGITTDCMDVSDNWGC